MSAPSQAARGSWKSAAVTGLKAMGLHGDAKVILTVEDDQVRLSPIGHGVSRAQALYREHAKQARTIDDFLSDRKAEASRYCTILLPQI